MFSFGSQRGAAGAGAMPLMLVAFLSVGGLMFWLFVRSAPVEVEVVEGDAVEENLATVVAADVFGADPMAQADMLIEVRGLLVEGPVGSVGSQAFFLQVPGQASPYVMRMLPEAVADGLVLERGATVSVTGMVYAMSDSVADSWVASGAIAEGDRILAIFAESFFEAEAVNITGRPRPDDD